MRTLRNFLRLAALLGMMSLAGAYDVQAGAPSLPDPAVDELVAAGQAAPESLVLAGGCFWGMQAVFQHVKGVTQAVAGYAGGAEETAHYQMVSSGTTGHAESVRVTYDPARVSLGQLLKVYFAVAHDPTELNYQGPDHGSQYRSAIFYATPEQRRIAEAYIAQIDKTGVLSSRIVTTLEPLKGFYAAEAYHQNYATLHPDDLYIKFNDLPKVAALQDKFPALYTP